MSRPLLPVIATPRQGCQEVHAQRLAVVTIPSTPRGQEPRPAVLEHLLQQLRRACTDPLVSVVIVAASDRVHLR